MNSEATMYSFQSHSEKWTVTRKSPRYHTSLFVRTGEEENMCESRGNVSAGGFCFEWECELEAGTTMEILFRLPGAGVWLKARGRVLGCVRSGDTLSVRGCFTEIELGDTELLEHWIRDIKRLHDPFGDDPSERSQVA